MLYIFFLLKLFFGDYFLATIFVSQYNSQCSHSTVKQTIMDATHAAGMMASGDLEFSNNAYSMNVDIHIPAGVVGLLLYRSLLDDAGHSVAIYTTRCILNSISYIRILHIYSLVGYITSSSWSPVDQGHWLLELPRRPTYLAGLRFVRLSS